MSDDAIGAMAFGLATFAADGRLIEARYPVIELGPCVSSGTTPLSEGEGTRRLRRPIRDLMHHDPRREVSVVPVETRIADLGAPAVDLADVYGRLHLLSSRRLKPSQVSLVGILNHCLNVAWTSLGPCLPERVAEAQWLAAVDQVPFHLSGVWPFPRMTDYLAPSGVKIMNAENVRLGAYLAPGTNVHGGGFCNTGSATLGPCMIEGRVSLGVRVGEGCHVGGGSSLMGVTSGGGSLVVSLGRDCLIGANAGVGIPLGDRCVVEAGCFVTAGMPLTTPDGSVVKAIEVSHRSDLLFRRNGVTGRVEVLPARGWSGLNPTLHA